jgi:hypothetical protein
MPPVGPGRNARLRRFGGCAGNGSALESEREPAALAQLRVAARNRRHQRVHAGQPRGHIAEMHLDLTDAEAAALVQHLQRAIDGDHFPLSPRVLTLQGILGRLEPPRARPAVAPEPRVYEPPRFIRGRRRRE